MFTRTTNLYATFAKSPSAICFTCNSSIIDNVTAALTVFILSTLRCACSHKQQQEQHRHQQQRQYYSIRYICPYRPSLFSMFAFVLCVCLLFTYTNGLATVTAPLPPPLAAALAAPVSSSILEQFTPNCSAVVHIFQTRGFDPAEMPQKPKNGK
uniref:Uncharacterized protein n=1 Tax=Glossina austeni TaxID=7395 RepID=A0A1A9URW4_GLOAU